jgi:zinc protease
MTIKTYVLAMILCCAVNALRAQSIVPENMFTEKLANGLTVLVLEDNSVPLATVSMTFKAGGFTESPTYSGLTYVYHNMLFKAIEQYGTADQANYISSQLGIIKNHSVTEENAECHFTLPSFNIDQGLRYMNSAMRFPILDEQELIRAKSSSDKELIAKETTAGFQLNKAMWQHLWGGLYNRKMAIGTRMSILSATMSMIDTVRKKYYYPNNALLIVAGKVDHDAIFKKVEEFFGSWQPSTSDPLKKWPVPPFKPLTQTSYFTVALPAATVPTILLAWQGPNTRTDVKSTYAADVFSYIVGQNASKLNKALVQTGLALNINFNYLTLSQGGPITFYITPNPAKIKECMAEVKKQISMFDAADYVTAEQIETAKRKLEITHIRQEEVTTAYVSSLSFWWASASLDYFFNYAGNLNKVTQADVQAYVRKYIRNKPYCAGLLISPSLRAEAKTDDFFKAN